MKAFAIAGINLRRLFRYRPNIFFVIIFPMLMILLLGVTFGSGFTPAIGIVAEDTSGLGADLTAVLEADDRLRVRLLDNEDDLLTGVGRGTVQAGLVIPAETAGIYDAVGRAELRFYSRPGSLGAQLRSVVSAAVAEQNVLVRAGRFVEDETGVALEQAMQQAAVTADLLPPVEVVVTRIGESVIPQDLGAFDLGASSQLLLFVFLTSLTGSVALIETRQLGLSRRMLSTPTPAWVIVLGEGLGRVGVALAQGLIIMLGAAVVFGVNWGDPAGAGLVLLLFALTGAGAGILVGSTLNTEQQAIPVSLMLGLGLAAIGGSMAPLEVFPETMRTVAHVTPHAWGNDAFAELVRRDGSVADILPELRILAAFAVVLLGAAVWRLRATIASGR